MLAIVQRVRKAQRERVASVTSEVYRSEVEQTTYNCREVERTSGISCLFALAALFVALLEYVLSPPPQACTLLLFKLSCCALPLHSYRLFDCLHCITL